MKFVLTLSAAESIALRRFARETGKELDEAAALALREYLISTGDLELAPALDEDADAVAETGTNDRMHRSV